MKTYRTKIDAWLVILILAMFSYPLVEGIIEKEWWLSGVMLLPIAFVVYLMFSIRYNINGDVLEIKSGFIRTTKIAIADITSVEKNNNGISAPAMSLKRLEIWYGGKHDSVVISPVDREAFVKELLKITPNITLKNFNAPK